MLDKVFDKLPYEQLEKIKFAHLLMGAAGVGLFLFLIYFFTLYSAGQEETTALLAKKTEMEKKLKSNEVLVAQTGAVTRDLAILVHDLNAVKRQMPAADEMPQLLRRVGDSEKDLSVNILSFKVEEGKVQDYYKEIPISINMCGKFWNSVGFFDRIQDLLQTVTFSGLKMEMAKIKEEEAESPKRGKGGEGAGAPKSEGSKCKTSSPYPRAGRGKASDAELEEFKESELMSRLATKVTARIFAYVEGSEDKEPPAPPAPPAPPPAAKPKK